MFENLSGLRNASTGVKNSPKRKGYYLMKSALFFLEMLGRLSFIPKTMLRGLGPAELATDLGVA